MIILARGNSPPPLFLLLLFLFGGELRGVPGSGRRFSDQALARESQGLHELSVLLRPLPQSPRKATLSGGGRPLVRIVRGGGLGLGDFPPPLGGGPRELGGFLGRDRLRLWVQKGGPGAATPRLPLSERPNLVLISLTRRLPGDRSGRGGATLGCSALERREERGLPLPCMGCGGSWHCRGGGCNAPRLALPPLRCRLALGERIRVVFQADGSGQSGRPGHGQSVQWARAWGEEFDVVVLLRSVSGGASALSLPAATTPLRKRGRRLPIALRQARRSRTTGERGRRVVGSKRGSRGLRNRGQPPLLGGQARNTLD
eukprot:Hpha_TRINITY_DN26424_c0_g1::TRINITY_DN26424_c0_g1_i1::g.34074::m.34074